MGNSTGNADEKFTTTSKNNRQRKNAGKVWEKKEK